MHYKQTLRKEVTPARLHAMLKLIARDYYKKEKLQELLQPEKLNSTDSQEFGLIFKFAVDTELIIDDVDGYVKLRIDKDNIFDESKFKMLMSNILLGNKESVFYRITAWVMKQDKEITKSTSANQFLLNVSNDVSGITDEAMLSWRFWAKYLGYGYNLTNEFIIPNPYKKILYLIENNTAFERNKSILFKEFIGQIIAFAPEFKDAVKGNNLSFSLSLAMRTLHDQGIIKLEYIKDALDIWHLDSMETHSINDVTQVIVKG